MTVSQWLAENPPPAQGPEFGGSSPIGLAVTLCLGVALIFLIRSMNKHLRKVPKSFEKLEEQGGATESERSTAASESEARTPPKQ